MSFLKENLPKVKDRVKVLAKKYPLVAVAMMLIGAALGSIITAIATKCPS